MAENEYHRMSSEDMATILVKYRGRVSKGLIEAIAARLVRNAKLLKGLDDEKERHQPTVDAVCKAAYDYVNEPTDANFLALANTLEDERLDVMQCVRSKALYSAAVVMAGMKGCPPGDTCCVMPLATCDGTPRADCWYRFLKAGIDNV